jgi:NADPH:quinone reductase-like Zn-dependent oxidoreductase
MKCFQFARFGLDTLQLAERPAPQPGPHDVLVRWHAWSLNYRDLVLIEGTYMPRLPLPFTPLSDGAGAIVAVGEAVTAWRPGDRVISHYLPDWEDGDATPEKIAASLGAPLPGLLADESVLPARALVPLPAHLSFAEGATLPVAALSAWNALFEFGPLPPHGTVLLEGTGGVSLFGLQLAHAAGLRTIITSSSDEKLVRARALGADAAINYRTTPRWAEEVRRFTDGNGVDLVLDIGGGDTLPEALRAARLGGRIAAIGFLGGKDIALDALDFIRQLVTLHGLKAGSRAMFLRMLTMIAHHRIRPVVDREFAFADVGAALHHLKSGQPFGKIVIRRDS